MLGDHVCLVSFPLGLLSAHHVDASRSESMNQKPLFFVVIDGEALCRVTLLVQWGQKELTAARWNWGLCWCAQEI